MPTSSLTLTIASTVPLNLTYPFNSPSKCLPRQVAVSNSGDVFVADGYCNSRVAQFRADGSYVREFVIPRVRAA